MIHRGTYDGTIYHNPANKFCIISVKTADKDVPQEARSTRRHKDHLIRFVATGYELPRTDAVELELDGEWKKGKYGMQLQVEQWHEIVPQTKSGVEGYLASGLIKGIGPALAKQIVSRFGVETLDILQNRPERLLEIKGITENKLEAIKTSYAESRMLQDLMTLLSPFKITPKTAQKIYQFFGPASVDILKKSPFELCQISGFGFLRVDAIVQKNGGDLRAPMRIKGALFWALEDSKGKNGHYQPLVRYEEEERAVADNLDTFPVLEWQEISPLTEHQRSMMRLPFLGAYLFNWHDHERKAVELLEQNLPLQKILMMNYVWGVELFLDADSLKNLKWLQMPDVEKFRRLMEAFEYDAEDLSEFWTLWLENRAGQYDVEWWLSQLLPISKERRQKILQSRLSYLNALYAGCLHINFEQVEYFQVQLLIYAVEHKKKHFLNLVNQNSELFFSLGRYSLLFVSGFCERCNLNSLTVKNLKDSDSIERTTSYFELLEEGQQYTFEELRLLWHQEEVYVRLYAKLSPLSVDQRMLTIRQLIKRDLVSQNIGDEALEQATQCLLEKPFGAWYEKDFGHIRGLTRQTAMLMLQHYPEIQAFIPEFRTEADAVFAVSNASKITGFSNWSQVCGSILVTDQNWAYLKENMGFSEEFVREYQPGIVNFLLRGGSSMVRPLYNELQYRNESEKNCEALRRIVQAELMGQFYKLKYFAGDLKQEIHYPIQEAREDVWKQNLSLTRLGLMAKEVDDFYHTIRMGELPHFTCLSCYQGSQRDCLLAAFDSNKKIILVYKDESVVARACLRLTKGSFQQPSTLNFEFADLSKEDVPTGSHAYSEKLVLFLEHIYTSGLKKSEETAAKEMVVALATQKAEELDAVAVLSNQYRGCYPSGRYVSAPIYIYISKSKNGRQYLDSLGGAAVTLAEEQYKQESFLVERAALDRAHAA